MATHLTVSSRKHQMSMLSCSLMELGTGTLRTSSWPWTTEQTWTQPIAWAEQVGVEVCLKLLPALPGGWHTSLHE